MDMFFPLFSAGLKIYKKSLTNMVYSVMLSTENVIFST